MADHINKSPSIAAKDRSQVIIHRDIYAILAIESIKRRLKVKDLVTHFIITGLAGLGVDVSEVRGESGEEAGCSKEVA